MSLSELQEKLENKQAKLAVIGLGYVGLPLACEFARVGFDVLGVDVLAERIRRINAGVSPIEGSEPGLAELLSEVISSGNLRATTDYQQLGDRDVVLICVETPVGEDHLPRYEALRAAVRNLGAVMKEGTLVIVESTIAPGTMQGIVLPLLEQSSRHRLNQGFYLGHCPERVMPGRLLQNLRSVHRVVGGMTPETTNAMISLYRHVVHADLDPADCVTAELVKTVENAYRDVQIAFANEVALICEAVGGDVWKVRGLVNKSPFRQMHLPGAGVGGHCIPKDPWLLVSSARTKDIPLRLIPAARTINDAMPIHVAELCREALLASGHEMRGAKILVLGYSYLEDSDDTRNSPSQTLAQQLTDWGTQVVIHDPYVFEFQGDVYHKAEGCHAIIVMVRHKEYLTLNWDALKARMRLPILIDGRGIWDTAKPSADGWTYRGVGVSTQR
jgi:UDP-N-acetyl-D-mannosaminuronic acid dehydrogenase